MHKSGILKVVDIDPQGSMGSPKGSMNNQGVKIILLFSLNYKLVLLGGVNSKYDTSLGVNKTKFWKLLA